MTATSSLDDTPGNRVVSPQAGASCAGLFQLNDGAFPAGRKPAGKAEPEITSGKQCFPDVSTHQPNQTRPDEKLGHAHAGLAVPGRTAMDHPGPL